MMQQSNNANLDKIQRQVENLYMETERLSKTRWVKLVSLIAMLKSALAKDINKDKNVLKYIAKKLDEISSDLYNVINRDCYASPVDKNVQKYTKYKQIILIIEKLSTNTKQLVKTFKSMGFIVYTYCKYTGSMEENEYMKIEDFSNDKFKNMITAQTICIFETGCTASHQYLELAKRYNVDNMSIDFNMINKIVETEENLQDIRNNDVICFGTIQETWLDFCNNLLSFSSIHKIKDIPSISVVVLNYNNKDVIFKCIESLIKYNSYGYEIIIVDNGSSDGSYEMLKSYVNSGIRLAQNNKNGCSSGRNLGVSIARNDFIVFLDSDQWVIGNNWLDCAFEIMKRNLLIGAISWNAGWFANSTIEGPTVDHYNNRAIFKDDLYRTDINYLATSGFLISKGLFQKIGGFDEQYDPTCFEDTDISLKLLNEGFEIAYTPFMYLCHLPHQTTKDGSKEHKKLIEKNGTYFERKWNELNPFLLKSKHP